MTASAVALDERFKIAFDQARAAIAHQDGTLDNLRSRATGLVATSTVVATFAAGLGLIGSDPTKGNVLPTPIALALVGLVIAIVGCSTAILLPRDGWVFYLDGQLLIDQWITQVDLSVNDMYRYLTIALASHEEVNKRKLNHMFTAYKVAVGLLLCQTILLVLALTVWSNR